METKKGTSALKVGCGVGGGVLFGCVGAFIVALAIGYFLLTSTIFALQMTPGPLNPSPESKRAVQPWVPFKKNTGPQQVEFIKSPN